MSVEERLRAWGGCYRAGRDPSEDRSLTGNSPISRLGKPIKASAVGRSSLMRRLLIPRWAINPVRGKPTRSYWLNRPDEDSRETKDVMRIQELWLMLNRQQPDLGQVLRAQYQVLGKRPDRCQAAATALGRHLTGRQYQYLLGQARRWMAARLT